MRARGVRRWGDVLLLVLSLCSAVLLLEVLLGVGAPSRSTLPDYEDAIGREHSLGGILAPGFQAQVRDGYGGTVLWQNNAQGFRYHEPTLPLVPEGRLRLLSLGDSFSVGYRVGQEQLFSSRLEALFSDSGLSVEIPAGHVGTPAAGMLLLQSQIPALRPSVVLFGITLGNDLAQVYADLDHRGHYRLAYGGELPELQRNPESSFVFPEDVADLLLPPAALGSRSLRTPLLQWMERSMIWRRLSAALTLPEAVKSHFREGEPRLFDPTHGLGFYLLDPPWAVEQAYERLFELLTALQDHCAGHGVHLVPAVWPQRFQVQAGDWRRTVAVYGLNPAAFDLDLPNRRIQAFCQEQGLQCLDPLEALREAHAQSGRSLYLPLGDMHWNAAGHQAVAEALHAQGLGELVRSLHPKGGGATATAP